MLTALLFEEERNNCICMCSIIFMKLLFKGVYGRSEDRQQHNKLLNEVRKPIKSDALPGFRLI